MTQPARSPGETSIESEIDLYDSDRPKINKVAQSLAQMMGQRRNIEGFVNEIKNRFNEQGYVVAVQVYEDPEPVEQGTMLYGFGISIIARTDPESEFDHERQAHEVQHDLLGLRGDKTGPATVGQVGGTQTQSGLWLPPSK